jgi:putative dehydrogenase
MSNTVGIVGLGIMGSAIFRNLVERGWLVIGFDIDAARRAELAQANFTIAEDVGCATPMFTLTQPVYADAMAMGLGDQDTAAVFEVLKKTIITEPRSG